MFDFGSHDFRAPREEMRLLRAGAEAPGGKAAAHFHFRKALTSQSIPGASLSPGYPDPSREFWSLWGLMVEWVKVSLHHRQSQLFTFLLAPVL